MRSAGRVLCMKGFGRSRGPAAGVNIDPLIEGTKRETGMAEELPDGEIFLVFLPLRRASAQKSRDLLSDHWPGAA
jgi:hypothetical protein